ELYKADPSQTDPRCLHCVFFGLPSEHHTIGAGTGGGPEFAGISPANPRAPGPWGLTPPRPAVKVNPSRLKPLNIGTRTWPISRRARGRSGMAVNRVMVLAPPTWKVAATNRKSSPSRERPHSR